jgi:hypothetical protein
VRSCGHTLPTSTLVASHTNVARFWPVPVGSVDFLDATIPPISFALARLNTSSSSASGSYAEIC